MGSQKFEWKIIFFSINRKGFAVVEKVLKIDTWFTDIYNQYRDIAHLFQDSTTNIIFNRATTLYPPFIYIPLNYLQYSS